MEVLSGGAAGRQHCAGTETPTLRKRIWRPEPCLTLGRRAPGVEVGGMMEKGVDERKEVVSKKVK